MKLCFSARIHIFKELEIKMNWDSLELYCLSFLLYYVVELLELLSILCFNP